MLQGNISGAYESIIRVQIGVFINKINCTQIAC